VEAGSDLYTANLVEFFRGDAEVADWLAGQWEPEELQHGRALRGYVEAVWPDFDWERTFRDFLGDYRALCNLESLRPTPALEMVSRCVVETGTATLYQAIQNWSGEPVLRDIVERIRQDEVRHFKHFLRYFRKYQQDERLSRTRVARVLIERLAEVRRDDASCAFTHVFRARHPELAGDASRVQAWTRDIYATSKRCYPFDLAVKMLLTPLELPPRVRPLLGVPLAAAARFAVWGLAPRGWRAGASQGAPV